MKFMDDVNKWIEHNIMKHQLMIALYLVAGLIGFIVYIVWFLK